MPKATETLIQSDLIIIYCICAFNYYVVPYWHVVIVQVKE